MNNFNSLGKVFSTHKKLKSVVALMALVLIVLMVFPAYAEGNIIQNSGFEEGSGNLPTNWLDDIFDKKPDVTKLAVEEGNAHSGSKCFSITNNKPNDSKVYQDIKVEPNKIYKVSCWIKTENIKNKAGAANITLLNGKGIFTSQELSDTKGAWENLTFYIKMTDSDSLKFNVRLGGYGTTNEGKAYFDDITMELVESAPDGSKVDQYYIPGDPVPNPGPSTDNSGSKSSGSGKIILIILVVVIVIGLLVFVEVKFAKRGKTGDSDEESEEEDEEDSEYDDEENEDEEDDKKKDKSKDEDEY